MHLHEHKAEIFLQARILGIFMSFPSVVIIVQNLISGDQIGEKGASLIDFVHVFKFNNSLIEGTRAQMSSGSK